MDEIDKLAQVLKKRFSYVAVRDDYGWCSPPLNVLACVLSLNRRYNSFVVPRVKAFAERKPNVVELTQLLELIDSYESSTHFSIQELNYNHSQRAQTLRGVVEYLINTQRKYNSGSTERERLQRWAISVGPRDAVSVGVRGFGLSGFQFLRMLFGAQTTKPDRHIKRFVSEVVGRSVNDETAIVLLEQAAQRVRLPLRAVDGAIWEEQVHK